MFPWQRLAAGLTLVLLFCTWALPAASAGYPESTSDRPAGREYGAPPEEAGPASERLARLEAALDLSQAQQPLWLEFRASLAALMADRARGAVRRVRDSAAQQIAGQVDTARNRLAALEDVQEASDRLYAALDQAQREVADRLLAASLPPLEADCANAVPAAGKRPKGERPPAGGPGQGGGGPPRGAAPMW